MLRGYKVSCCVLIRVTSGEIGIMPSRKPRTVPTIDPTQFVTHSDLSHLLDSKFENMQRTHKEWRDDFKDDIKEIITINRQGTDKEISNIQELIKNDRKSTQSEISAIGELLKQNRNHLESLISQTRESTEKLIVSSSEASRNEADKISQLIAENRRSSENLFLSIKDSMEQQIKESREFSDRQIGRHVTAFRWVATFSVGLISVVLLLLKFFPAASTP